MISLLRLSSTVAAATVAAVRLSYSRSSAVRRWIRTIVCSALFETVLGNSAGTVSQEASSYRRSSIDWLKVIRKRPLGGGEDIQVPFILSLVRSMVDAIFIIELANPHAVLCWL